MENRSQYFSVVPVAAQHSTCVSTVNGPAGRLSCSDPVQQELCHFLEVPLWSAWGADRRALLPTCRLADVDPQQLQWSVGFLVQAGTP